MAQKSIKKNTVYVLLQKLMSLLMPIITFPYASRILLPEGIGKVNFAHSIVTYFTMLAGLGVGSYAIREGAKIRDNYEDFSKFAKEMWTINIIATLVSYLGLVSCLIFVNKLHPYTILILICSANMLLGTMGLSWLYNAQEEFKYITIRTITFQILSLFYLFIFVKTKNDIIHYTIFGIISGSGSNICNFIYSKKFINWKIKTKLEIKKHLKPIFTLFGSTVAQSIYLVLDISILGFISGDVSVGYYSAANKLNKMVLGVITVLNNLLLPRLSYYVELDKNKYYSLLRKGLNMILILCIPIIVGFFLLSKQIIFIFCGEYYSPAIITMNILTPLIILIPISSFCHNQVFLPLRKDKYCLYPLILGAAMNLILNFIMIPKFSHNGAAIATLISEFSITCFSCYYVIKLIGFKIKFLKELFQYILSSIIMGIAVYFISKFLKISVLNLAIEILSGVLIYYLCLLICRNFLILQFNDFLINRLKRKKEAIKN